MQVAKANQKKNQYKHHKEATFFSLVGKYKFETVLESKKNPWLFSDSEVFSFVSLIFHRYF